MTAHTLTLIRGMLASCLLVWSSLSLASPQTVGSHLESSLDEQLRKDPLSIQQQYEMTRQGLAETIELQGALLRTGALSPRGWVLDCGRLRQQARAWTDRTDTLTGVFLGASLLEYWVMSCRSRLQTAWTKADLRRIERATLRASRAFPASWPSVSAIYTPDQVREYLDLVNRKWGVLAQDRECSRQALRNSEREGWGLPRTVFESTACKSQPFHGMLSDPNIVERLEGVPMATTLATSFLGLDRWVIDPETMARVLTVPHALENLIMEMIAVMPVPMVLQEREGWFAHVKNEDQSQDEAHPEIQALAASLAPVLSKWPDPHRCKHAGDQVRQSLAQANHFPLVLAALLSWPRLQAVCPEDQAGFLEEGLIDKALVRVTRHFPQSPARRALSAPLGATYLAELEYQSPPARMKCIQEVLNTVRQESDILPMGLRRARAYCPVAYQTWLSEGEEE